MSTLSHLPTTLMFHAEALPPISDSVGDDVQTSLPPLAPTGPLDAYTTFLASRPPVFETHAIAQILSLAHVAPSLHLHIVHLSAIEAIPLLRDARAAGVNITAETCPHYLSLVAEEVQQGDTRHKCCPPIRGRVNQDGLWTELMRADSVIQTIVSDHSPCTPELKLLPAGIPPAPTAASDDDDDDDAPRGDFFTAWGGISSVGLSLPILLTEAARRGFTVRDVVRWCCEATAAQVGLAHRKGRLAAGWDADVAVLDDTAEWVVEGRGLLFRNRVSAYEGRRLTGRVRETWLRGRRVFGDGGWAKRPLGELLLEVRTA